LIATIATICSLRAHSPSECRNCASPPSSTLQTTPSLPTVMDPAFPNQAQYPEHVPLVHSLPSPLHLAGPRHLHHRVPLVVPEET
jgi:hypothetical protein